jgi:hypothetical protein
MNYFENVELGEKVYSIIYGEGVVEHVLESKMRVEGFFMFGVRYANAVVHYTDEGIPNWCSTAGCSQTVFYKKDIDIERIDFTPIKDVMTLKKIEKNITNGLLEIRCPSGIWQSVLNVPEKLLSTAISKGDLHLFRKCRYTGEERRKKAREM